MAKRHQEVAHVSLHDRDIVCFHCGARERVIHEDQHGGIPINSPAWAGFLAHGEAFERAHARCPETASSPTRRIEASLGEWERGLFVGSSSGTIFAVLHGRPPLGFSRDRIGNTPQDPSDFNRCHRLLQVVPAWRSRLGEVAAMFPSWAPLVGAWDELTAMLDRRDPGMYDRMKALLGEGDRG